MKCQSKLENVMEHVVMNYYHFLPGIIMHSGLTFHYFNSHLCYYFGKCFKSKALKNSVSQFPSLKFCAGFLNLTYKWKLPFLISCIMQFLTPCIICLTLRNCSWNNWIIPQIWFCAIYFVEKIPWNSLIPWHYLGISLFMNTGFQNLPI